MLYMIHGGNPLDGEVRISGAKNRRAADPEPPACSP